MKRMLRIGTAVLVTILVCALVIKLAGRSPLQAFLAFLEGALLGVDVDRFTGITDTLRRMTPLFLLGLSVMVSFRCAYWNIGAEGQFILGAIAATVVGVKLAALPGLLLLPLILLAGAAAGAFWSAIAGWLRVHSGVQEIISTIMLNFVAIRLVQYVVRGPLRDGRMPQSPEIGAGALLPRWETGEFSHLDLGFLIAAFAGVAVWVFIERSVRGFELRAVGAAPVAAAHAGLNPNRTLMLAVSLSGALAGMAGALSIAASASGRLTDSIATGDGYRAIAVALLGGLVVLGTAGGALLFGALEAGAQSMETLPEKYAVSRVVTYIVQAMVIFFYVYFAAQRLDGSAESPESGELPASAPPPPTDPSEGEPAASEAPG